MKQPGKLLIAADPVLAAGVVCLLVTLTGWALLHFVADAWWPATLMMYGPKLPWLVPTVCLIPFAFIWRWPRSTRPAWRLSARLACPAACVFLVLGPVMNLRLNLPLSADANALRLKVLTLNTDGSELDGAALGRFVASERPDVVLLQAWSSRHEAAIFGDDPSQAGWHLRREGELLFASRWPIVAGGRREDGPFVTCAGGLGWCDIQVDGVGRVRLFNVHLASPRSSLTAAILRQADAPAQITENARLRDEQAEVIAAHIVAGEEEDGMDAWVLGGDFNMTMHSAALRRHFGDLTSGFDAVGVGWGHTHYTRRTALRIDHFFASAGWRPVSCRVGPVVGSAHRPLLAEYTWQGTSH